ncbi:hypothetical protein ACFLTE_01805 [Bacteroidota bacterium]
MNNLSHSDYDEVNDLIEIFNSRMNKLKDYYDEGKILEEEKYIEDTEEIIQEIEKLTGRYSIE